MSRESKVLIGVGALVVIGLILALIGQPTIGVIAVLIGLVAGVAGLRFTKPDASDPFADARTEADLTQHRHADAQRRRWRRGRPTAASTPGPRRPIWPRRRRRPTTPRSRPRPTRRRATTPPPRPRPTRRRPTRRSPSPRSSRPAPVRGTTDGTRPSAGPPRPSRRSTSRADHQQPDYQQPDYQQPDYQQPEAHSADLPGADSNPLDDLVGLDALDPIAEVERIEGRGGSLFGGDPTFQAPIINEQVSTADDIMAASQATELNLGGERGADRAPEAAGQGADPSQRLRVASAPGRPAGGTWHERAVRSGEPDIDLRAGRTPRAVPLEGDVGVGSTAGRVVGSSVGERRGQPHRPAHPRGAARVAQRGDHGQPSQQQPQRARLRRPRLASRRQRQLRARRRRRGADRGRRGGCRTSGLGCCATAAPSSPSCSRGSTA